MTTVIIPRASQSNGELTNRGIRVFNWASSAKELTGVYQLLGYHTLSTAARRKLKPVLFCLTTLFQLHGLYSIHHNGDIVSWFG